MANTVVPRMLWGIDKQLLWFEKMTIDINEPKFFLVNEFITDNQLFHFC